MEMVDARIFSEMDFLKTLNSVLGSGFEPFDISDILNKFSWKYSDGGNGLGACCGIAYCDNELKIVQKNELLEYLTLNYGLYSTQTDVVYRDELRMPEKHRSLLEESVTSLACFKIVPEIFEALQGKKYNKEDAKQYGFVEGRTTQLSKTEILGNPLLLDMVNGDINLLNKLAEEGIGINIGERTKHHRECSCSIKTWLLYKPTSSGRIASIWDIGLNTYDYHTPLFGRKK
jgi:hypothetical protein